MASEAVQELLPLEILLFTDKSSPMSSGTLRAGALFCCVKMMTRGVFYYCCIVITNIEMAMLRYGLGMLQLPVAKVLS